MKTWSRPTPPGGGEVDVLVAGMKAFSTYHMRAFVDFPGGTRSVDADHTFTTGGLPAARLPQLTVRRSSTLTPNPGVEYMNLVNFFTPGNPAQAVVTDLDGNVIWYYDPDPTGTGSIIFPFKFLPNGNVLVNLFGTIGGSAGVLREIDLAGDTIRELSWETLNQRLASAGFNLTVSGIHHDFALLPNGHLILLVNELKSFTDLPGYPGTISVLGDGLVDLDENWNPVWTWDSFDRLDVNRHPQGLPDWTHSNAVIYSSDDGNLLLSSRHQSWVLKIDYEDGRGSGDILWRFGYQGDFTLDAGAPAAWAYGQHDIRILSPNSTGVFTLGMFDNGFIRVLDDSGTLCGSSGAPACYSRVPFFQVDQIGRTAHVQYEVSSLPYSFAVGSIEVLPNGNLEYDEGFLALFPARATIKEVTQESTPQTVWEVDEAGQIAYRAFRIPSLYPGVQW